MCIAVAALGGISGIASIIGTGVSVIGTLAGAAASANAANASARQNENNAIIAARNANDARDRGNVAMQDVQMRNRARFAAQKNALSEKSINVGSGSALDILGDTAMFGKLDELTTGQNFEREAIAFQTQQYNFSAQAEMDKMEARNAGLAGTVNAFSTVLGGVADFTKPKQLSFGGL